MAFAAERHIRGKLANSGAVDEVRDIVIVVEGGRSGGVTRSEEKRREGRSSRVSMSGR